MRPLRVAGLLVTGLLVVVVLAVALVPLLVDTALVREQVETQASMALGQEVRVVGGVRLALLPRPALRFEDVRVRNPRWSARPELLSAPRVTVTPVVVDLLRGVFTLDAITVDGAEVWLVRDGSGRLNWQRDDAPGALSRVDRIEVRDSVVHYADGRREGALVVERLSGAVGDDGRLTAAVHGRLEQLRGLLSSSELGALGVEQDDAELDTRLVLGPGPELALASITIGGGAPAASGTLQMRWGGERPRVDAKLQLATLTIPGRCVEDVAAGSGGLIDEPLPDLPDFGHWMSGLELRAGRLRFGSLAFPDVRLSVGAEPGRFAVRAASNDDRIDLALARPASGAAQVRLEATAGQASAPGVLRCLGLSPDAAAHVRDATLELEGAGDTWRAVLDGARGRVRIDGTLAGAVTGQAVLGLDAVVAAGRVERIELELDGVSGGPLAVTGSGGALIGLATGEWPFEARWTAPGHEGALDGVLIRTNGDLSVNGSFSSVSDHSKAAALELEGRGRFRLRADAVELGALEFTLGGNTLKGELVFDLARDPIAVGGDLALGATTLDWLTSLAPGRATGTELLPPFAIDALRVRVAELEGLPVGVGALDTRVSTRGKALRLDPLSLVVLSTRWTGGITLDTSGLPLRASYELAADEATLSQLPVAGDAPIALRSARKLALSGRWTGTDLSAVTSSLELDASAEQLILGGLPVGPRELALDAVAVRYRPQGGLSLGGRTRLRDEALELRVDAKASAREPGWRIDASVRGEIGELRASGGLDPGDVVQVDAQGPDLNRLLALLEVPHGGVSGGWGASTRISRDGAAVVFSQLQMRSAVLGMFSGEARLTPGERPRIDGHLASERLDLASLAPPPAMPEAAPGRRIPNVRLPVPPAAGFDADISLHAGEVLWLEQRLADVNARLRVDGSRLVAEELHAVLGTGGEISGRVETVADGTARRWALDVEMQGVDLGRFLAFRIGGAPIGWPADVTLDAEGVGDDLLALLSSARGRLRVSGQKTVLGKEDFSIWDTNLFSMMLPQLTVDQPARMNCASIVAELADGRLTTEALVIDAENVTIAGTGSLEFATEALDMMLAPRPKQQGLLRGSTPVRVTGTLSAPEVSVATGALVRSNSLLLLGALNPYLLLAGVVSKSSDEAGACDQAVRVAEEAPADVEQQAAELEKSYGGITGVLTAPLRIFGVGGAGKNESPAERAPSREQ